MAIHKTVWSPDTCSCVIEYSWDDTQPEDSRTHNLSRVINRCPAHQAGTEETTYNNVLDENPRKNLSMQEILDNAPTTLFDIDAESGQRVFKKGITVDWNWSGIAPDRILNLIITGITLTTTQKNAIRNKLNTRFGINKVTFN